MLARSLESMQEDIDFRDPPNWTRKEQVTVTLERMAQRGLCKD